MPYYDFIVKLQNQGLVGLFGPFCKRDDPKTGSDALNLRVSNCQVS